MRHNRGLSPVQESTEREVGIGLITKEKDLKVVLTKDKFSAKPGMDTKQNKKSVRRNLDTELQSTSSSQLNFPLHDSMDNPDNTSFNRTENELYSRNLMTKDSGTSTMIEDTYSRITTSSRNVKNGYVIG